MQTSNGESFKSEELQSENIPTLVTVFNRPRTLRRLIAALRIIRPTVLYFASDGPREDADMALIKDCRDLIAGIDWPCEVTKFYAETNLGMRENSRSAIEKVFQKHDGVLVLEDDCIPHHDSFSFLATVIASESSNRGIASIGLFNPIGMTPFASKVLYSTSTSFRGWGPYILRGPWEEYIRHGIVDSLTILQCLKYATFYPGLLTKLIRFWIFFRNRQVVGYGDISMDIFFRRRKYLSVVPTQSLLKNEGFGPDATHTKILPDITFSSETSKLAKAIVPGRALLMKRVDVLDGWLKAIWFIKKLANDLLVLGLKR